MSKHTLETKSDCIGWTCTLDGVELGMIQDETKLKKCAKAIIEKLEPSSLIYFITDKGDLLGETIEERYCDECGCIEDQSRLELDY